MVQGARISVRRSGVGFRLRDHWTYGSGLDGFGIYINMYIYMSGG